jgi:hypothetical protein
VIANFVSLKLHFSPIIQPRELRDGEEKCAPQLPLVQLRNSLIELHAVGVVEGKRYRSLVVIPWQDGERRRLSDRPSSQKGPHQSELD